MIILLIICWSLTLITVRLGDIHIEDLIDNRFMRKLDESGFSDRLYSASGQ